MGNGESTAMRISMQKTDEGHVQVGLFDSLYLKS